jgi:hypothetical protein
LGQHGHPIYFHYGYEGFGYDGLVLTHCHILELAEVARRAHREARSDDSRMYTRWHRMQEIKEVSGFLLASWQVPLGPCHTRHMRPVVPGVEAYCVEKKDAGEHHPGRVTSNCNYCRENCAMLSHADFSRAPLPGTSR